MTSRRGTSASSASTSSPGTGGSGTTTSRSSRASRGSSSTRDGFKLRLSELEHGAVNVVVQPGHWRIPRVDHLGVALDEDGFQDVLGRAMKWNLRIQEHGGRRTFIATNAGYRLEVHPPREWIDDLLERRDTLRLDELQLSADDPGQKAAALADLLGLESSGDSVQVGDALVRFLPGGPEGRPELVGERFA